MPLFSTLFLLHLLLYITTSTAIWTPEEAQIPSLDHTFSTPPNPICAISPLTAPHTYFQCAAPSWYPWQPASGTYAPWTKRVMCIDSKEERSRAITTTYCLFVNKDFAQGRGIILLTTPYIADLIAQTPAFTDPSGVFDSDDYVQQQHRQQSLPTAYEVRELAGKGIGLIAKQTIHRDERIMQEPVAWIVHRDLLTSASSLAVADRVALAWHAAYSLPIETRAELLALTGHSGIGDRLVDVLKTNSFGAFYDEQRKFLHHILLPRTSRINHDCRPNAHYYFDTQTMTHYIHAVTQISAGEEITISYTETEAPYSTRQSALALSWRFSCQCSLCRQPLAQRTLSDSRLAQIAALKASLNDWSAAAIAIAAAAAHQERTAQAKLLSSLYAQERLWAGQTSAYEAAAWAHAVVGHEAATKMWASRALQGLLLIWGPGEQGQGAESKRNMRELMERPTEHSVWLWAFKEEQGRANGFRGNETEMKSK